jgi:hypothetical protein
LERVGGPERRQIGNLKGEVLLKRRVRKLPPIASRRRIGDERDAATKYKKAPGNPYRVPRAKLEDRAGYPFGGSRYVRKKRVRA